MSSPSQPSDSVLSPAIKQSFLHALVRKTPPIAKLTPLAESTEMDLDTLDLPVPSEVIVIKLYPDLISFIKSKLRIFYAHSGLTEKLDAFHTMDMDQILVEAFRANTQLRSESMMSQTNATMMNSSSSTMSVPTGNTPSDDVKQSFLHEYLRFIAPVSIIRLSHDDSDMDVAETPFEVPPDESYIVLFDSLVLHMRKKLKIYYQVHDDNKKVATVDTMNDIEVVDAIYTANIMMLNKKHNENHDTDNNMQDTDSETGIPLSTQASSDTQRNSTHDRSTASKKILWPR